MFRLKPITREGVEGALVKAERYRFLNEPAAAESICRDVLEVDPDNQPAIVMLLLSITDQLPDAPAATEPRAREILPRLKDEYKRAYYEGITCERRAQAQLKLGSPGSGEIAYGWFREAMACYERAEAIRPPGNDESILRWNTCARMIDLRDDVHPPAEQEYEPSFE